MGAPSSDAGKSESSVYKMCTVPVLTLCFNQALPCLLKDFIKDEVDQINRTLANNGVDVPPVTDPSGKIQLVLNALNDWYNHLRQPLYTSSELIEIQHKTYKLMWLFKEVFPSKSGET
jgi:hypothetical protein